VVFTNDESSFSAFAAPSVRVFVVSLEEQQGRMLNRSVEFWQSQLNRDTERGIHRSYELYWIWALKTYFVAEAADMDTFGSDWFFWLDIGGVRASVDFWAGRLLDKASVNLDAKMVYYACVEPFAQDELEVQPDGFCHTKFEMKVHLAGGLFLIHRSKARDWADIYRRVFDQVASMGYFVGKDQDVLSTACVQHSSTCALLPTTTAPGDQWFSILYYVLGMMPNAMPYNLAPVWPLCYKLASDNLPRNAIGAMAVHHWDAGSPKWNELDRWRPFHRAMDVGAMYIGANADGSDGVRLLREHPNLKLHVYEPVPEFFEHLMTQYGALQLLTEEQTTRMHNYGLGADNRTVWLRQADINGQSTFIMEGAVDRASDDARVAMKIRDASFEIRRVAAIHGHIQLLHVNCEGCEWELFDSCVDSGVLSQVDVVQYGLHYLPLQVSPEEMAWKYCKIHTALSRTHVPEFLMPFGWERWVIIQ
jgi:FkbM family methyltransferase